MLLRSRDLDSGDEEDRWNRDPRYLRRSPELGKLLPISAERASTSNPTRRPYPVEATLAKEAS
jgi:hypothetical protein